MKTIFLGIIALLFLLHGCEEHGPELSSFYAKTHKSGTSCMKCHSDVQVCGTVYDSTQTRTVSDVIVKLSTTKDTTGLLKAMFEVDKSGNFYTIYKTEFAGLYPSVEYPDGGKAQYMQSSINTGDCNSCHIQGNRIWIK